MANDVRVRMSRAGIGAGRMGCWSLPGLAKPEIGPNHKLHPNTHIAKDCKLAPALPIMPRLDYISFFLEAGVVSQIGRSWPGDN